MSQTGSAAVSEGIQDAVSFVKCLTDGRLDSTPPPLQLRTLLQDVSAPAQRLQGDTLSMLRTIQTQTEGTFRVPAPLGSVSNQLSVLRVRKGASVLPLAEETVEHPS